MSKIKLLDCTLRDGGYLNNWEFGCSIISDIQTGLNSAGIDYVECGFLSEKSVFDVNRSVYPEINYSLLNEFSVGNVTLMVNYGDYDFSKIEKCDKNIEIRIAFKPNQLDGLKDFVFPLTEKGINFSINPMHISLYSKSELLRLADISNELNPTHLTGVDTMGIMNRNDVKSVFGVLDTALNNNIALGFHSHNNLNLSFDNVKTLLSLNINRDIIIDSSLFGLARGGGMLSTRDIAIYLNDTFGTQYDICKISMLEQLVSCYAEQTVEQYYLSAKSKCHPNYAKFLFDNNCPIDYMTEIFESIPLEHKPYYSEQIIKRLFNSKKNSLIS